MTQYLNATFHTKNRKNLSAFIKSSSVAIIHSNDQMPRNGDCFYPYRQNSDLFYLTGIQQEETILLLCPNHANKAYHEILFLLKPTKEKEIWEGYKLREEQARQISGIQNIQWIQDFNAVLREILHTTYNIYCNENRNKRFNSDVVYRDLRFQEQLKEQYPEHTFRQLYPYLEQLRLLKQNEEINTIKHACNITRQAFDRILKYTKPGVFEYEIAAEITHEFLRNGAQGHAYEPIVASGINACVLHYIENNSVCKDGDLVLMDFGAEYNNYASDCTRTIPVNGKFTKRQQECYEATLHVFNETKKWIKPGVTINEYHLKVCNLWEDTHIKLGLYTKDQLNRSKEQSENKPLWFNYYMHGTSHFMGLDVHDVGEKDIPLQPGMVLTLEPGLYIQQEGIGIRLENDLLITSRGNIDLMNDIPISIEDIIRHT